MGKLLKKLMLFPAALLLLSSTASAQTSIYQILQTPFYDPNSSAACAATGSVAGGAEALSKQSGLDPQWIDLINKDANKYGTDPFAMASILYWENRGWPAFGRLVNGDPASGMGPWQFIGDTWDNGFNYSRDQVYDPIPSTDAAAQYIKSLGGVAGSKGGSIDQDFSKGSNIPSMATVMKNYNAGGATYRTPGTASYLQAGRVWYDGNGNDWATKKATKPKTIDDYIVAGTYLYYQIASGQPITYNNESAYIQEALGKQDQIKNFSVGSSTSAVCTSSCSNSTGPVSVNGKTVVIDPGHAGDATVEVDPASGLETKENGGAAEEMQNMWDTAQIMKTKLEKDGYTVVLTKSSEADTAGFVTKVAKANAANADIAVSLHYTPGNFGTPNDHWGVTPQEVGRFRENKDNGKRLTFTDAALAQKSQQYAKIVAEERDKTGDKANIVPLDQSFPNGRNDVLAWGDISIVQLLGKIPWVYNETGLSGFDKQKYADGITNGIEKALSGGASTTTPAASSSSATTTSDCGAVAGSIVQTAVNYAWPDYHKADYLPKKPAYQAAVVAASNNGEYVGPTNEPYLGIDCGAFVTRVMLDSGADPGYNYGGKLSNGAGNTLSQQKYLEEQVATGKYQKLGQLTDSTSLKPGDIAINTDHTYLWEGEITQHPDFHGNSASASFSIWRAPMADNAYFSNGSGAFTWYRLVK